MMDDPIPRIREAVASLLRPPTPEQRALLSAISGPFLTQGIWPVFDYVESVLDEQGVEAVVALSAFPSWPTQYSAWWPGPGSFLRPEDQLALTVAGLALCSDSEEAGRVVDSYIAALRYLADRFHRAPATPTAQRRVEVTSQEIAEVLWQAGALSSSDDPARRLAQLNLIADREPTNWRAGASQTDAAHWSWQVGRVIRAFVGVESVEQYLERLAKPLFVSTTPAVPAHPSSLSLPEAIDFLDAVWQLRFGHRLFRLPGAVKTAKLALPCATSDEYEARLSALADILARMQPLGSEPSGSEQTGKGKSLKQVEEFLRTKLPESARQRVRQAGETLRAINALRRGRQHHGADRHEPHAYRTLGLIYPPGDWGSAWGHIQMRAVEALNALREELQASEEPE